ncbi:hypothetical protein BLNAU_4707 [Blattamonas nauphoetae]|uniref:F-box/LRR-repeat protein 15-like leucin rich repeat domain-containing protein n=1 Tax=Blattamonas nauphoetae TaxID=2049346 RepID=A0ABQ9Y9R6_9EUKA|nr:hypothetical protein BLNAU_4707 [Blattamonas nauphoetae]
MKSLTLKKTKVNDAFIVKHSKYWNSLEKLDLSYTTVSVRALASLKHCTTLKTLSVKGCRLGAESALTFCHLIQKNVSLSEIDLSETLVNESFFKILSQFQPSSDYTPHSITLFTSNCSDIVPSSNDDLSNPIAPNRPVLFFTKALSFADCMDLQESTLTSIFSSYSPMYNTKLTSIDLTQCFSLSDRGIHTISSNCPNLEEICLWGCSSITDSSIACLSKYCHRLSKLDVTGCTGLTDLSCIALSGERGTGSVDTEYLSVSPDTVWKQKRRDGVSWDKIFSNLVERAASGALPATQPQTQRRPTPPRKSSPTETTGLASTMKSQSGRGKDREVTLETRRVVMFGEGGGVIKPSRVALSSPKNPFRPTSAGQSSGRVPSAQTSSRGTPRPPSPGRLPPLKTPPRPDSRSAVTPKSSTRSKEAPERAVRKSSKNEADKETTASPTRPTQRQPSPSRPNKSAFGCPALKTLLMGRVVLSNVALCSLSRGCSELSLLDIHSQFSEIDREGLEKHLIFFKHARPLPNDEEDPKEQVGFTMMVGGMQKIFGASKSLKVMCPSLQLVFNQ